MASINFDLQDQKDVKTIAAIAALLNYQPTILDENGNPVTNPMTSEQFAKKMTRKWWRELRLSHAVEPLMKVTRDTAINNFNNNDPEE